MNGPRSGELPTRLTCPLMHAHTVYCIASTLSAARFAQRPPEHHDHPSPFAGPEDATQSGSFRRELDSEQPRSSRGP